MNCCNILYLNMGLSFEYIPQSQETCIEIFLNSEAMDRFAQMPNYITKQILKIPKRIRTQEIELMAKLL